MSKRFVSLMAVAALVGVASTAEAQNSPFALEIRGGLAFPSGDLKDLEGEGGTESGVGLNVNAQYQVTRTIGVYGEYNWLQFGIEDLEGGDVTDQGFGAGVMVSFPAGGFTPFVKAGLVMHEIELSLDDITIDAENEELGFRVGAGAEVPLGQRLSFTPGVTFTTYNVGAEDEGDDDTTISHIAVDVGLKIRL